MKIENELLREIKKYKDYESVEFNHSQNANLSEKPSCFHVFDIPRSIYFKGDEAKQAILKMFTSDKLVNAVGKFFVAEIK